MLAEQDVPVDDGPVAALEGRDGQLERVVFADGGTLARDAIFGGAPIRQRSDLAEQLGCALIGHAGSVEVDDFGHTSVPGVLAVGDMAQRASMPGPMQAVPFASAAGMLAGVAVDRALHAEATGCVGHARQPPPRGRRLLIDGGRGDDRRAEELLAPYRRELYAHCYRMTGLGPGRRGRAAGRDAAGVACARAAEGARGAARVAVPDRDEHVARPHQARPDRVLPFDHGGAGDPHDGPGAPLTEIGWIEPYPDGRGGLDAGSPRPRRGTSCARASSSRSSPRSSTCPRCSARCSSCARRSASPRPEAAELLETTVASVNSALQRARASVEDRLPDASQQQTLKALGDEKLREIVADYVAAWERGDVEAVVAMLADEATMAMPPMALWFRGRDAVRGVPARVGVRAALGGRAVREGERDVRLAHHVGERPARDRRLPPPDDGLFRPYALQVLTFREDGKLADITAFVSPQLFPAYGLPESL